MDFEMNYNDSKGFDLILRVLGDAIFHKNSGVSSDRGKIMEGLLCTAHYYGIRL
jgi:hypothetical protein